MGYVEMRSLTSEDNLDTCDKCDQSGLYENGVEVKDDNGYVVLWLCFNCKQEQHHKSITKDKGEEQMSTETMNTEGECSNCGDELYEDMVCDERYESRCKLCCDCGGHS